MKKNLQLLCFSLLLFVSLSAHSQKYRSASDTVKLNKEYVKVGNEISELTSRLAIAQNNRPEYQAKAKEAANNAQNAADVSSDQALKATDGSVKEAKRAKRKAKHSYNEAKDARSANDNVDKQDDKISSLTAQLNKKKQRLQELDEMRTAINAQSAATIQD